MIANIVFAFTNITIRYGKVLYENIFAHEELGKQLTVISVGVSTTLRSNLLHQYPGRMDNF